jgi:cytosine/adenosine deaminase-related metal-dependent hydrolase
MGARLRNVLVARPAQPLGPPQDVVLCGRSAPAVGGGYQVDLSGHALLPALVNLHDHLAVNAVPGLTASAPFANSYEWARAFEPRFADPIVAAVLAIPGAIRHWHGGLKNLLCGTTTVMHHDPWHPVLERADFPVHTPRAYGWAHSLHWPYGPAVQSSFRATPRDVPWFIHLAEGTDEVAAHELRELHDLDCLHSNTILIHGVGLDDAAISQVIQRHAALVWCPASNRRILGRTLPQRHLRALFDAGRLALGTDSRLSGSRDLLEELRAARSMSDFSAHELSQLVTVRAQRLLGSSPARQDFIVLRRHSADPFEDLLQASRRHLRAVIRDGEPLLTDPDFEGWFERRGIAYTPIVLDAQPKLCARTVLSLLRGPHPTLEPGLRVP